MTQVVESLPSNHEALSSNSKTAKKKLQRSKSSFEYKFPSPLKLGLNTQLEK
jgi:hypothetical protein